MASVKPETSIREFQDFVTEVYGVPNDRDFELWEMLYNVQRFALRGLKGIRQGNIEKARTNILITMSWFCSTMTRLHIDVEGALWERFPNACSFCGKNPCSCEQESLKTRRQFQPSAGPKPKTMSECQKMLSAIYPSSQWTVEKACIHMAEELGELTEAIWTFKGEKQKSEFDIIRKEAADYLSTVFAIFSALNLDIALELSRMFHDNCHVCHKAPCECSFKFIRKFK